MTSLTTSIKHFASLNRALGPNLDRRHKRKALHKPLLLLAVLLDLVQRGILAADHPPRPEQQFHRKLRG
ncbi:hypothetical protein [Pelotalea chapellei]|uniref:Uncharacterized protein n=1 Tax=Pelotalea chapellei TaxID=44671 RepID=A0ABS5U554_9BACT|nr:hypothetical protein [Pelotalea chapellei]MBT1070782.1 hypothetical protein [Pelotalea chapellei]